MKKFSNEHSEKLIINHLVEKHGLMSEALEILEDARYFYYEENAIIYSKMVELYMRNEVWDIATLPYILQNPRHDTHFWVTYLVDINISTTTSEIWGQHLLILKECWMRRKIYKQMSERVKQVGESDVFELLEDLEQDFEEINSNLKIDKLSTPMDVAQRTMDKLEKLSTNKEHGVILPYGVDFYSAIGDLHGGDVMIIAGRPGMGKTSLLWTAIYKLGYKDNMPVGVIAAEATEFQTMLRPLTMDSGIDLKTLRSGKYQRSDIPAIVEFLGKHAASKVIIEPCPVLTPKTLQNKIKKMKKMWGVKMIGIDYIQLTQSSQTGKERSRERDIADVSRMCKQLAMEYDLVIIPLAQLNREVENRSNKRPQLSDLRESGSLEQDSDYVVFVYRPEEYGIQYFNDASHTSTKDMAELIIAKGRYGGTASCLLKFVRHKAQFLPIEYEQNKAYSLKF